MIAPEFKAESRAMLLILIAGAATMQALVLNDLWLGLGDWWFYQTLAIEVFPTGLQLIGCNGVALVRSWVPNDVVDPWPDQDSRPDVTVVVSDPDNFALAFMKTLQKVTNDETRSWIESGGYDRILRGDYPRRGEPDRDYQEDLREAADSYAKGAKDILDGVAGAVRNVGDSILGGLGGFRR